MEKTGRIFVLGLKSCDGEPFIDCLSDTEGRCLLRLRREEECRNEQTRLLKPSVLAEVTLYAPASGPRVIIRVLSVVEDFAGCRSDSRGALYLSAVTEATARLTAGPYLPEVLPFVLRTLQALEYDGADGRALLVRLLYYLLHAAGHGFSPEVCGKCGHRFIAVSKFFFDPVDYRMVCTNCITADSVYLRKNTYFTLKRILHSPAGQLQSLEAEDETLDLLLFLFREAVAVRFGDIDALTKLLSGRVDWDTLA